MSDRDFVPWKEINAFELAEPADGIAKRIISVEFCDGTRRRLAEDRDCNLDAMMQALEQLRHRPRLLWR